MKNQADKHKIIHLEQKADDEFFFYFKGFGKFAIAFILFIIGFLSYVGVDMFPFVNLK